MKVQLISGKKKKQLKMKLSLKWSKKEKNLNNNL